MKSVRQTFFAAVTLYSDFFMGIVISLLIARSLQPEDYGMYSAAIWGAATITLFITSGVSICFIKFGAQLRDKPEQLSGAYRQILFHQMGRVGALLLLAGIAGYMSFERFDLLMLATATVFGSGMIKADYVVKVSIFKGMERFDINAKSTIVANIVTIVLMASVAIFSPTLEAFLFAFAGSSLSYWLSLNRYRSLLPRAEGRPEKALANTINKQVWAGTLVVFGGALLFRQSQVQVLESFDFKAAAGFFNIGYVLGMAVITLVPGIYNEVLLPKIAKSIAAGNVQDRVQRAQHYLFVLSLMVVVPVLIFAEGIVTFLYGPEYSEAAIALQVLVIGRMLIMLSEGANLTFISQDKQHEVAGLYLVLLAIGIPVSIYFVSVWGYLGALATYTVLVLLRGIMFKTRAKYLGYRGIGPVYLLKFIAISALAAIPSLLLAYWGMGFWHMLLGAVIFILVYLHLMLVFRGLDPSAAFVLRYLSDKLPRPLKSYANWGARRLAQRPS